MERDDFDRFLSKDEIVPSSGFVARVMDAVRVEAAAPPAIPFPWSRALPGLVATAATFVAVIGGFFGLGVVSGPSIEEQGVTCRGVRCVEQRGDLGDRRSAVVRGSGGPVAPSHTQTLVT